MVDYTLHDDSNIIVLRASGQSSVMYFDLCDDVSKNEDLFKETIDSDTICRLNINYLCPDIPKPSNPGHKWIILAGGNVYNKPWNVYTTFCYKFYGDVMIAQSFEGRIVCIPNKDVKFIPRFYLSDISTTKDK